jgi:predicted ATPase
MERGREAANGATDCDRGITYFVVVLHYIYLLLWNGDFEAASGRLKALLDRAARYSFAPYYAVGLALKGELLTAAGDAKAAVEALREALESMLREEHHIVRSPTFCALAVALSRLGRPQEARDVIEEGLKRAKKKAEVLWLPDLLRRRGEILQELRQPDFEEAESSFLGSIKHAQSQTALSWELKAAIPLARMWKGHGREKEARLLLKKTFGRFTEGLTSPDLVFARRLLDELS